MNKQVHIITNKGCDLYPQGSIHLVNKDKNGIRWTKEGNDTIHPMVESKSVSSASHGKTCSNCKNIFIPEFSSLFVSDICNRCHEKRTVVGRNT